MKRNSLAVALGVASIGALIFLSVLYFSGKSQVTLTTRPAPETKRIFSYQCIDTMKVSRDKARLLPRDLHERTIIASEVQTIASLGANCIAVGTPYDEEFLPYLGLWVREARKAGLAVWFRGNFSSWEGWFDYQTDSSVDAQITKTAAFIKNHPTLFADGDIFSPIVEPENGGPFKPLDSEAKNVAMRDFLTRDQAAVKQAFSEIHKHVVTNLVSLSGGAAQSSLDVPTIQALNQTVTLDHYVRDPKVMAKYLDDFHRRFGADVALGEFGAPIPDLNGDMSDKEQAAFVDALLNVITARSSFVHAINYWTLTESSTALIDDDNIPKPVVEVIKNYYLPGVVHIHAVNRSETGISSVKLDVDGQPSSTLTDARGEATLTLPAGKHRIKLTHPDGTMLVSDVTLHQKEAVDLQAQFVPESHFLLPFLNFLQLFHAEITISY